ncbi:hypothetical protein GCM10027287_41040 [Bordetella muralis]
MYDRANGSEGFKRRGKKPLHIFSFGYIRLRGDSLPPCGMDSSDNLLCLGGITRIIDDDLETIGGQA